MPADQNAKRPSIFGPDQIKQYALQAALQSPQVEANSQIKEEGSLNPYIKGIMLGGGALDGITTQIALGRGGRELYPLLPQNQVGNAAMKALSVAGTTYGLSKLAKQHPTLANVLGAVLGGTSTVAGIHNLKELSK